MNDNGKRHGNEKSMAIFAVAIMLAISIFPILSAEDSDGELPYYSYTINTNAEVISGTYSPIGSSSDGPYVSSNGENVGSWGFNSDGYGPFNSFYAAFDPTQNNRMVCHLDPNDLTRSVDGDSIAGLGYNIMWCLPTVYWSTDASGNLILSNDPSKGTAYAHKFDGKVYNYIALGVYEGTSGTLGGETLLTSMSGMTTLTKNTRASLESAAQKNLVNTLGEGENGYAMLWHFYQWELYKYCVIAVMGSWDSQGVAGNGAVYNLSALKNTGLLDDAGPYAGTIGNPNSYDYGRDSVKVFIENAWGNIYEYVGGVIMMGKSFVIESKSRPTNATTAGEDVVVYQDILPYYSGMGSETSTEEGIWGIPTNVSNENNIYDMIQSGDKDNRLLRVGGSHHELSRAHYCGVSHFYALASMDETYGTVGSRLAFVFDDDIVSSVNVTFVSNGSALQTQVIDSGATAVSFNPALDGYTFKGWYTDNTFSTPFDFATKITENITLFAKWEGNFAFTSEPTAAGNVKVLSFMDGTVVFDASASNGSLIVWDFGDGTTAAGIYQTHYYSQPGNYTVKLMVYNDDGKVDIKEYNVYIPDPSLESLGRGILPTIAIVLVLIIGGGLVVRHLL